MTTKQNAIALANTARSEAAAITNGTKRTIAQIISNWNECVKQSGFMCIYDFPTTGYSRKSQIADDLTRCAGQLDDYCEPNPHAPQTVEQHTRELNAALTRVLDADEAHAEALEEYDARNTLYVYAPGDAARKVWDQMTPIEQTVSVELRHAEALEMNRLFNMRAASDDRPQRLAKETGFPVLTCLKELIAEEGDYFAALERLRQIVSDSHSEALEENYRFGWLTNRFNLFWGGCNSSTRRSMTERAHDEALKIDAQMMQDAWDNSDEIGRSIEMESAHTEALTINAERQRKLDAIWRGTHRDYKSSTNGVRSIMVCRGATCLVPLSGLTDKEINQRSTLWE
ncbi:hypothetical protein [Citrobacter braakii]|uniref:hypothetical protein n=1 Tax=Citrobacter braakii TaxID=57706 RepID=UPI004039C69D